MLYYGTKCRRRTQERFDLPHPGLFQEASFRKKRDNCDLVLSDVNLTVRPGELVYLIGHGEIQAKFTMKPWPPNCRWSKAKGGCGFST
ncbi:MAG: hypothetical protein ACLR8Y_20095 [Alistipes indistinctus]